MLKEGASASIPAVSEDVSNHTAEQFTAQEALAIELIRELAIDKYHEELVDEVQSMLEALNPTGIQILLATAMRFPNYGLLSLYQDVLHLQNNRDKEVSDGVSTEDDQ